MGISSSTFYIFLWDIHGYTDIPSGYVRFVHPLFMGYTVYTPSGDVKIATGNDPVEIVDFPMKHGDFP